MAGRAGRHDRRGQPSTRPLIRTSLQARTYLRWTPTIRLSVRATQSPSRLLHRQGGAGRVSLVDSGSTRAATRPSGRLGTVLVNRAAERGAARVQRVVYTVAGRYGATGATTPGSGNNAWTNPGNATGTTNGTNATHAGQALAATSATLDLTYAAVAGKTALTLTQVRLRFYVTQAGTLAGNGSLVLSHGASGTPLATISGDSSAALTYDVTAAYPTWVSLAAVTTRVVHSSAVGQLHTATVDAVELLVDATVTDTY